MNISELAPGDVVEIKGFIHKEMYGDGLCHFTSQGMEAHGYPLVGACNFKYVIPADFNLTAARVQSIDKQIEQELAKVSALREQKQQLLQLTMDDGTVVLGGDGEVKVDFS